MKTQIKTIFLFALLGAFTTVAAQKNQKDTTVCYKVSMECMACKAKIEKNIAFEKGVKAFDVNLAEKTVKVKFNKTKNTTEKLKLALENLDYEVEVLDLSKKN